MIMKGREKGDAGIYTNWMEVAPKVNGVSGNSHVKCDNLEEAQYYLKRAGFGQDQIDHFRSNIHDNNNAPTRKLRERKKPDYRALHGGNSKRETNAITASPKSPTDEEKLTQAKKEVNIMTREMDMMRKKSEKDDQVIQKLTDENSSLRRQLQRETEEKERALQKVKTLAANPKPATPKEKKKDNEPAKIRINLIADSNRKHIIEPLRKSLTNCTVVKIDQLYTTTHLVNAIRNKTIPEADLEVILMGTNDVREEATDLAMTNLNTIGNTTDPEKTMIVHIPPIEIGNPDDDEYEQKATDRTILNRHISRTFPDNHIKIAHIQKAHHRESILASDGFHLTKEGGLLMAKAITTRIIEKTDPTSRTKAQEPQAMSNQQAPKPQSPHRKQPKKELVMVIPPGIGRHVIGRNGRVINDIKNKCMVEIETAKAGTGDEARVTITGRPDRVKDAEKEINAVISYQLDMQEEEKGQKKRSEKTTCTYYLAGNCRYGNACWKMHPQQEARTRSRSPNRNQPDKSTPMRTYHSPRRNNRNQEPGSPNRRSRQNQRAPRRPSPKPRSRSTHTARTSQRPDRATSPNPSRRTTRRSPSRDPSQTTRRQRSPMRSQSPRRNRDHTTRSLLSKLSDFLKGSQT